MRTLTLAGVPLQVLEAGWDTSTRPATMTVQAKNSRPVLERLTTAVRGASLHPARAGDLVATVQVTGLTTDKHRISLRLQPVEMSLKAAG